MKAANRRNRFLFAISLRTAFILALIATVLPVALLAQSTSGVLTGTVKDPTGAAIVGATVTLQNQVSGYSHTVKTGFDGTFRFPNVPFNPYQLVVTNSGFQAQSKTLDVETSVPQTISVTLQIGASTTVSVDAGPELVESDPTFHADIDRSVIDRLPVESPSSALSSIVTLASPGVAADSNGLMHGLGDHAENSFSIDGEPITDQQSKVFSSPFMIVPRVSAMRLCSARYRRKLSQEADHRIYQGRHPLRDAFEFRF